MTYPWLRKSSEKGKRAFLVPLAVFILTFIPVLRVTIEWLDTKIFDLFFSWRPHILSAAGKEVIPDHPLEIIYLDATFSARFFRDMSRQDLAELTEKIAAGGGQVLVLDYLFENSGIAEEDERFGQALAQIRFPLLAQRFISRGIHTFEGHGFIDRGASRPPWPTALFRTIADNAAGYGLINLLSDYDSVHRYAPVAFNPVDGDGFLPSLGYAAWIAALINDKSSSILKLWDDIPDRHSLSPAEAVNSLLAQGPYHYNSTGHIGIDEMNYRLEQKYIARLIDVNLDNPALSAEFSRSSTWLQLPEDGLPLIGDCNWPALRLPFNRLPFPLIGDGMPHASMGRVLSTEREKTSSRILEREKLVIKGTGEQEDNEEIRKIRLQSAICHDGTKHNGAYSLICHDGTKRNGGYSLSGRVIYPDGEPVKDVSMLLYMRKSGYWDKTSTDATGCYTFENIPEGHYLLKAVKDIPNGRYKAVSSGLLPDALYTSEKRYNKDDSGPTCHLYHVPELIISGEYKTLCPARLPLNRYEVMISGEPIPLYMTGSEGEIDISAIAPGLILFDLDSGMELFFDLEKSIVLDQHNEPFAAGTVAVLNDEEHWKHEFSLRFTPDENKDSTVIKVPYALHARIMLLKEDDSVDIQPDTDDLALYTDIQLVPGDRVNLYSIISGLRYQCQPGDRVSVIFEKPDNDISGPITLLLVDEYYNFHQIQVDNTVELKPGSYLVLISQGDHRTVYRPGMDFHPVVFAGTALPEHQDFVVTPVNFMNRSYPHMPGVNFHAHLFSALRKQVFVKPVLFHPDLFPEHWHYWQFAAFMPILVLLNMFFARFGAIAGGSVTLLSILSWIFAALVLFVEYRMLPVAFPVILLFSFGVARGYVAWAIARRLQQEARNSFRRFISSDVVNQILKSPDILKPGGEKKELTVMFTDLAGFTTISEQLEPERLTALMNEYLDEMTKVLFAHSGTLDKYIGDAIMCFWNHPREQPDHSDRAVSCAVQMQLRLAELREKWMQEGLPAVNLRIGLHRAYCMVGFMGSSVQMNFTCLGDGVNLAARLEGANKLYGSSILISKPVYDYIDASKYSIRYIDNIAVKGKSEPIDIFEVRFGYHSPVEIESIDALFMEGIRLYRERKFTEAIAVMQELLSLNPSDDAAREYIRRCEKFALSPPPSDWDGSYVSETK